MRLSSIRFQISVLLLVSLIQCGDSESIISKPEPDQKSAVPELLSPENQSEQPTSLTLSWQKVEEAESYQVQLSTMENFDSLLVDEIMDSTNLQIEALPEDTTVYWRARSQLAGRQSNWSEIFNFLTESSNPSPDPVNPGETELRIMPLGDSITEAFGYRLLLWNKLTNAGFEVNYVGSQSEPHPDLPDDDHEGHGGWYIGHIANNINEWLTTYQPSYILLMIGTNDIAWWSARNGAQIAADHNELVGQILNNTSDDTWILVASIPPQSSEIIGPNNVDRAQLTRDFNAEMEQYMEQRTKNGKQVIFVNIHSALTTDHLSDGIHPNQKGYEIITDAWYEALMQVLSQVQQ